MFHRHWLLAAVLPSVAVGGGDNSYTGDATSYTLEQFSADKCKFMFDPGVGDYYAALNSDQWNSTLNCGRCAEVSCEEDTYSTVTVYIVDKCAECEVGGLGLSPTVIRQLTATQCSINWKFVDCPVSGNIEYCVNSLSNNSWLAVQPANAVSGVASMKINSQSAAMADSAYYFVLNSGSNIDMSAVSVELTSISGENITETVSLTAGNCTAGTTNFGQQQREVSKYFDSLEPGSASSDGDYKAGKVTPPDDTEQTATRSEATASGTNLLLVVPVLVVVVAGAIAYAMKRGKSDDQRHDRDQASARRFGTFSSPMVTKDSIAKI